MNACLLEGSESATIYLRHLSLMAFAAATAKLERGSAAAEAFHMAELTPAIIINVTHNG